MQYEIVSNNYVLFGPASFDECQEALEVNLCEYRDHCYNEVEIVEKKA